MPSRPSNLRYVSAQLGTEDLNQLLWDAVSTTYVTTWIIETSESYDFSGTWIVLATVANSGADNVYTVSAQVADRWFRIKGRSSIGNDGFYAGPVSNRDPARTITVKGYLGDMRNAALEDGTVEVSLSTTSDQIDISGYRRIITTPITVQVEAGTGFWDVKLLTGTGYNALFRFRGRGTNEVSGAKVLPTTGEDVWFSDLANA